MARTQYQRLHPCAMCRIEGDCADNGWCLYDPYNKKCPNWLHGVKEWKKFLREEGYRRKRR